MNRIKNKSRAKTQRRKILLSGAEVEKILAPLRVLRGFSFSMVRRAQGNSGHKIVWGIFVLGWFLATAVTTFAQTPSPIPLDDYWAKIEAVQTSISALKDADPATQQTELAALAAELEQITAVTLADGRVIAVNPSHLVNSLRRPEPDLNQINNRLGALLSAKEQWPDSQISSLDQTTLSEILSQPAFQYDSREPNAIQRLWQEVRRRGLEFLSSLLPDGIVNIPLGNIISFAGVVILAVVLAYIILNLFAGFAADANLNADGDDDGDILTADIALQRAQNLSGGGDYRTAVRYLYLSSLLLLEEHGHLRYDRSLTNREYLGSIANRPRLAAILQEVIEVFDSVWYGFQPIEPAEYESFAQQVEALKKQRDEL